MTDFDANKFAAEVLVQATEQATRRVAESGAVDRLRRLYHLIADAYGPFLEKTYRRVSTIRTFLRPNESVDLLDAYVPVDLTDKKDDITVHDVIDRLHKGESFVVSGLAGRGKSVLMRFIALSMYHSPRGKLPLFLELRSLNSLTSKNLLQLIHSQYKGESSVKYSDFLNALGNGYFCLILDGFDEISPADRADIEMQILRVVDDFPACSLIVSGRSDNRFSSWEALTTYYLKAMNRTQAINLIKRARYDEDVKKTFLKRLTTEFFEKHESFLSTPLLAIMLMLTFEEYAEIPHSLHEFYRNAFDTLVRRHDAMKSQFLRKTHSGCTAEEFKRIFSSFCVLAYAKNAYSFGRVEGIEYIASALKQQSLKYDAECVLDDLIESICLLQEEGFLVSFVHRSFQEYFCALFLSSAPSGVLEQYLDSQNLKVHDDVVPMLYGINPDRFEDEWARDFVEGLLAKYPPTDSNRYIKLFLACCNEIMLSVSGATVVVAYLGDSDINRRIRILHRVYTEQFSIGKKERHIDGEKWGTNVLKEAGKLEADGVRALGGIGDLALQRAKGEQANGSYRFKVNSKFESLIKMVQGVWYESDIRGLERVRRLQRARQKQGNQFISELFKA